MNPTTDVMYDMYDDVQDEDDPRTADARDEECRYTAGADSDADI